MFLSQAPRLAFNLCPQDRGQSLFADMKSQHYDIVRKEGPKGSIWLEAASDLNAAESRIEELASFWPGTFQIMDQRNHQIVEETIDPSDRHHGVIRWTKKFL